MFHHVTGLLDTRDQAAAALTEPGGDPMTLTNARLMQVSYEVEHDGALAALPTALHPSIPPHLTWLALRCEDSAAGPFTLVQTRLGCRAGMKPRGFLLGAYINNPDASDLLARRWGYGCTVGRADLEVNYDRVRATAGPAGARPALDVELVTPQTLSSSVNYAFNLNLAETPWGRKLVQVDTEVTFHTLDRGRPRLRSYDPTAWHGRVVPVHPVAATVARVDITFHPVQYICAPDELVEIGTEKVPT
jgi:hypothetical protein